MPEPEKTLDALLLEIADMLEERAESDRKFLLQVAAHVAGVARLVRMQGQAQAFQEGRPYG